jgi:hypothetical protein
VVRFVVLYSFSERLEAQRTSDSKTKILIMGKKFSVNFEDWRSNHGFSLLHLHYGELGLLFILNKKHRSKDSAEVIYRNKTIHFV